jgi:hypothetical protein
MKKVILEDNFGERWIAEHRFTNTICFPATNMETGEKKVFGRDSEHGIVMWADLDIARTLEIKEIIK